MKFLRHFFSLYYRDAEIYFFVMEKHNIDNLILLNTRFLFFDVNTLTDKPNKSASQVSVISSYQSRKRYHKIQ